MTIPDTIKGSVKDSVGYAEAQNKSDFMVGASVAFHRSEDYFEGQIKSLTTQLSYAVSERDTLREDIKTIVTIFNKYPNYE